MTMSFAQARRGELYKAKATPDRLAVRPKSVQFPQPSIETMTDHQLTTDDAPHVGPMRMAIHEAQEAAAAGDVPVGAVIVDGSGRVVARGRNRRELRGDPTAHAEIEALRALGEGRGVNDGGWRCTGLTLYVTLEPCVMCAGALLNARIDRVVYGCRDPKAGATDSLFVIGRDPRLNHRFEVIAGVLAEECSAQLTDFFRARRGGAGGDVVAVSKP